MRRGRAEELRRGFDSAAAALASALDPEQEPIADRLAELGADLSGSGRWGRRRRRTRGVYLHGPVGRGKTWLVDVLLAQLPAEDALRLHAYQAARRLHREVARSAGRGVAVDRAVDAILDGVRDSCDVLELAGPVDHRALGDGGARPGWSSGAWLQPGSGAQLAALGLAVPTIGDRVRLQVGGRPLWALHEQDGQVQLSFVELCEGRTSVGDLLELADRYRTIVVAVTPLLADASPDARRRFADLVDVCWDRDVRLVVLSRHDRVRVLDTQLTDRERITSRLQLLGSG